jgi:uncharacterized protein (DUF1330 family)
LVVRSSPPWYEADVTIDHHAEPTPDQLAAISAYRPDGPFVALNLNRYRERAAYPAGTPDGDVSGREAYMRYGVVAFAAIKSVGGSIVWATEGRQLLIGCEHDVFHEVVAVWYPSRAAFLSIENYPGYRHAFDLHRRAAIAQAVLVLCDAGTEPELTSPFGS